VVEAVEQAISKQDPAQQRRFSLLLRALDYRLVNWLLVRKARRFEALSQADKEKLLGGLAISRWSFLRRWFQAIKRLAAFYCYGLADAHGRNAAWPVIGYKPPGKGGTVLKTVLPCRLLRVEGISKPTVLECEACVIGSGAGGGVVAAELAQAGKSVIVLEAGSGRQAPDFDQGEVAGINDLYLDQGLASTRDLGVTLLAGATLGGGTTVNWQTCLDLPPPIRAEWAQLSGCRHFVEDSFGRSLKAVNNRLQVSNTESIINPNNAKLRQGCEALGYQWRLLPRNAARCDPDQCGHCVYGCRHGGKQSTAVTYLYDAQRSGNTRIIVHCRVDRVLFADGRVTGVAAMATDPASGAQHEVEVRAPVVVAAAGALHSPALLMRSGLSLPALGRHLFLHPTALVAGGYDERIEPWTGPPQTILCEEFGYLRNNYGFRLEAAPGHPGTMAQAAPWLGARQHREFMQLAGQCSAFIVLVRDRDGGTVRLSRRGQPVIDYLPGRQEIDHLKQGMAAAVRIHLAAGARQVLTLHTRGLYLRLSGRGDVQAGEEFCRRIARHRVDRNWCTLYSAHQMGTCRMGRNARTAVCDADGQVFGMRGLFIADASAFPASSGVNPMITVMALAHHTAQRIKLVANFGTRRLGSRTVDLGATANGLPAASNPGGVVLGHR
jgi:choline dehydrogenase-like flavoprotein